MIKPHFEYCSSILFMCNNQMMNRLQKLQNRAMRIVLMCNGFTPIREMLLKLSWMSVNQRILYNVIVFVFKIKFNILPNYLNEYISYVSDVQPFALRNAGDFRLQRYRNLRTMNMVLHRGLDIYNSLPNDLKIEQNLLRFKKRLIGYVKNRFI